MNCKSCGAPVPAKSNICRYCHTVNDTDLRAIGKQAEAGSKGERVCPRCSVKMQRIVVAIEGGVVIDRCNECLGIFFDPGEVESLVDSAVSGVHLIDKKRMANLVEEEGPEEEVVKYVKCPVCQELMNRKNYGARSGVIVDICREHGVWLDGGELGRIVKWAKAGGQLHAEQRMKEEERAEHKRRIARSAAAEQMAAGRPSYHDPTTEVLRAIFYFFR